IGTNPLVSIGVAIYNEEQFLTLALESLVSQDYPHIEIIICDNASTDRTGEICQAFRDKYSHIKYFRSETNRGAYANGQLAIQNSKGKYFMYAAGHDLWHPTFISKAVRIMEEDPDIVLCYARTMRIDTSNNSLGLAKNSWDLRGMPPANRLVTLVNNISGGDPCYGLIRFEHLSSFEFKSVWGLDQVMLAYYSLLGTIAHISEPLFYWRMTDNENVEVRKKTVPLDVDPINGKKMLTMSMPELWQQMGEATLQVISRSDLSMPEKLTCKDEVRKCFARRYGVRWNEIVPPELKNEGKNVLLATSAAPDQTPFSTGEKRPPIGVGFLISTLREEGHNVFFIDNYLSPSSFLETDYLKRHRIDFVGIYTNTICFRDSLRMFYLLEELRQRGFWNGKIIAGGPHASVCPETIPPFVDHIVIGEGEYAVRDIVSGKVTERIVHYPSIENLDELPMPAWDYFSELPYNWGGNWLPEAPVFTMNTSRGCPFSCTFCSVCSIWGKHYTYFSAERIVADIEHVVKNFGARGIYFREDNFTLKRDRLMLFCQLMIERNIGIPWVCESRVSNLDRELVQLMARAGAVGFYFGVESGSQRLLDFMKKGITVQQIRNAFQWCHELGIKTAASVIVGVPTENEDDLRMTASLLEEIKPTVTWFNIFVGIPDSELLRYAQKHDYVEFIDDRGLAYMKGHNRSVELFYGSAWDAKVPVTFENGKIASPLVSVVMSVHNGECYLRQAIQSIFCQSFLNYEFIIIDDASTDATPDILLQFKDPRLSIIRNSRNLGLTASLNIGIRAARGKYIARMDADDLSVPHRLARQVEYLENNPEIAVVGSSYYTMDE
ncbi:MAG: glycosyltransferase, partial [Clostridiales bacterium]|nr:glycosyltransferase [Clostridiales bacterium]